MIFDRRDNAAVLRKPLSELWENAIGEDSDFAVIHSSLIHLRLPMEGLEEVFVESLCRLARRVTIALPAFTYSFCVGKSFHYLNSPSETGVLANWLLKSSMARRTPDPIFSFVVLGPRTEELMASRCSTTFGQDSRFAYFEKANATFVMLGCGWRNCTQFHYYEELAKVPYRYYKVFSGLADFGDGFKETQCRMFVRNLDIEAKNDFSTAEFELKKHNKIKSIPFCQGRVESVRGADLSLVCKQLLQDDPLTWVKNKELVAQKLS